MRLSEKQAQFMKDVALLVMWADRKGWYVTGGELHRPLKLQGMYLESGKTRTLNSKHTKRLAIDLFLFINGEITWNVEDYRKLGEFWESIRPENKWGGHFKNFTDGVHFQRNE